MILSPTTIIKALPGSKKDCTQDKNGAMRFEFRIAADRRLAASAFYGDKQGIPFRALVVVLAVLILLWPVQAQVPEVADIGARQANRQRPVYSFRPAWYHFH